MSHSKKKGFTLIEILIVISIIAILAGVTIAAIAPARKKGRDAQRVSDLANIRIALALYKSANGTYPVVSGWAVNGISGYQPSWNSLKSSLAPYLALPTDPRESGASGPWITGNYHYAYAHSAADGSKYDLITQFEDTNNPNRCEKKGWRNHRDPEEDYWCLPWPDPIDPDYSRYIYADH